MSNILGLTDEEREIQALARRFADEKVAPGAAERDREKKFPKALVTELGELGLLGVPVPVEHGGAGSSFTAAVLVISELARVDSSLAVTVSVHLSVGTQPILLFGTDEQIQRLVPPLAQGHRLAAIALTETHAGSDLGAVKTEYRDGKLHGTKQWVTNGTYAGEIVVIAKDSEADGKLSAFIVSRPAEGMSVIGEQKKMGLHASNTADLAFDGVVCERLGEPGAGMRVALGVMDGGRIGIAAQATGLAQGAMDLAIEWAKEREAFGGPIARLGQIQAKIAEMSTDIEAARALMLRAARLKDAGEPHTIEGAQAKLFASRVARFQTGEAIQILGGAGYMEDLPAERYYRDAKITEIYEGTSEVQRIVIARGLLGDAAR
ncbi:MAG: acyl-CoA dehydrogenase family protein [Solirubrobacterales bacterium]|nr:acyl-CoA dehydrogenase family protein [Solirubrobacterales bacterium]